MNKISQTMKVTIARADFDYPPFVMTALVEVSTDYIPQQTDRRVRQMANMMAMDTDQAPAIYDAVVAKLLRTARTGVQESGFSRSPCGVEFQIAVEAEL